jgi:hypothetical protein
MTVSPRPLQSVVIAYQVDVSAFEGIERVITIAIAALSILLLALSLSAYRRTHVRRLLYAAAAFGLFAVQTLVEFLEDISGVGGSYAIVITPSITLAILVLFFLAIVSKGSPE